MGRPLWVRILNVVARGLAALRLDPFRVDADKLIRRAQRATGLDDFGGDSYREPLDILVRDVHTAPGITPFARLFMREHLHKRLCNRLRIEAAIAADPTIEQQPIARPIFVLGLPRTGTTLLHRLLAEDPANRAPLTWELDGPAPPPDPATHATDPRIAEVQRELDMLDRLAPEFKAIHELGAELPEECIGFMANDLASVTFMVGLWLPEYSDWLDVLDMTESYARHKRQLQLLQAKFPPRRWVLKAPFHLYGLEWLLGTYPDACIVQTHRDPLAVIPSAASLMYTMRSGLQDGLTPADLGQEMLTTLTAWLDRAMAVRARAEADPTTRARFVDAHYRDVVADPIETVRRVYAAFGDELTDDAEQRMRAFLDDNRQHKHGKHTYTLEQFSLDPAQTRAHFAAYCSRFGV